MREMIQQFIDDHFTVLSITGIVLCVLVPVWLAGREKSPPAPRRGELKGRVREGETLRQSSGTEGKGRVTN